MYVVSPRLQRDQYTGYVDQITPNSLMNRSLLGAMHQITSNAVNEAFASPAEQWHESL